MKNQARGYIASGEFNGNRVPQHLQNQIIKHYCDSNELEFVLSRAEYWINGSTQCQLWAALKEGLPHVVFFSLWQLPVSRQKRKMIYEYCIQNNIILHFATERMRADSKELDFADLEILIESHLVMLQGSSYEHLNALKVLI
ncbi:LIC12192 family sporadic carbohydrate cluster protein [Synechococcus sp. HIMB2401]|uniref:LIC12192 family sporadic carbohydrate cluster protein n=1 Tax=Synechococcus sp. HIMB2401 TaxID=3144208 RepID=UPI0036F1E81A